MTDDVTTARLKKIEEMKSVLQDLGLIILEAYQCKYCRRIFDSEDEAIDHITSVHKTETIIFAKNHKLDLKRFHSGE